MVHGERIGKNNPIRILILTLVYFLYLFPISIPGLPIGTAFMTLVLMLGFTILASGLKAIRLGKSRTSKMLKKYLGWTIFLLVYVNALLQLYSNIDGSTPIEEYIQMLIILPIFYISGNFIFRNIEELMMVLYIGGVIQSIIIFAAKASPLITAALILFFPEGAYNTDFMGGMEQAIMNGYNVGFGVMTSAGSLRIAITQIGAFYFLVKSKGHQQLYHLIIFLVIALATSLVSKTGLLISITGLFCAIYIMYKQGGIRVFKFVFITLTILVLGLIIVNTLFTASILEDTFQRFIFLFENGVHDSYFRGYLGEGGDNTIPPISPETIVGLGITYGTSGSGIQTITDGGFMRSYSAMGLIVGIFNYLIIFNFFRRAYRMVSTLENKGMVLFMFLIFIIGEFKETFIYYIYSMCFIYLIFSLMERNECSRL